MDSGINWVQGGVTFLMRNCGYIVDVRSYFMVGTDTSVWYFFGLPTLTAEGNSQLSTRPTYLPQALQLWRLQILLKHWCGELCNVKKDQTQSTCTTLSTLVSETLRARDTQPVSSFFMPDLACSSCGVLHCLHITESHKRAISSTYVLEAVRSARTLSMTMVPLYPMHLEASPFAEH